MTPLRADIAVPDGTFDTEAAFGPFTSLHVEYIPAGHGLLEMPAMRGPGFYVFDRVGCVMSITRYDTEAEARNHVGRGGRKPS